MLVLKDTKGVELMIRQFDFEKIPVVDAVNEILVDSAKRGASDIHFDPLSDNMKIRIRIDGLLHDYAEVPNTIKKNLITRVKIISGMNITETRLPQDGAIKTRLQDINLDLRVSCIPTNLGEKIVIRILDYSMSLSGIEALDFSEENFKKILEMISTPNGIILVTGATGSGKSTTVYSMLQRLNVEESNVITVEDPVEMSIEGINQIQVNSEIGLTFASALRSILRQDPNVIMIGEIRDTETAKIAVRASITGHLVLSTIHTNNSLNTIERLLDMDVERYLLASALEGIISQVLARRLCPHCKKLRKTNDYEKDIFKKVLNKDIEEIYDTEGCEECSNGYSGRIAIHEVLLFNQDIRDAISSGIRKEELRTLVYNSGVNTMLEDGLEKVLLGETTLEEVIKLIEFDDEDGISAYGLQTSLNDIKRNKTKKEKRKNKELPVEEQEIQEETPEETEEYENNLFDISVEQNPINVENEPINNISFDDFKADENYNIENTEINTTNDLPNETSNDNTEEINTDVFKFEENITEETNSPENVEELPVQEPVEELKEEIQNDVFRFDDL